jgi:hypothetical protein
MRAPQPPVRPQAKQPEKKEEPKETGSDIWNLLTQIPRPSRKVELPRKLPGTDESVGEISIWPLTHSELIESNAAAEQRMRTFFKEENKKDEVNLGYQHSYANELAVQHLWRACRDPNDLLKPAFPSPKAASLQFTGDEIGVLYNHFLTVQAEVGPITSTMSDEEYEAWVNRIAEAGTADPFDSLSWDLQRTLVVSMASQLASYWMAMSSVGSQLDDDTQSSSPEAESSSVESGEESVADTSASTDE